MRNSKNKNVNYFITLFNNGAVKDVSENINLFASNIKNLQNIPAMQ